MSYLAEMRKKGKYDHYAWPGGYPLFYVTKDSGVLCPTCANENAELCKDKDDPQWYIVATDANWEDPDLYCDHCNKRIESTYAEDDAPNAKRGRRAKSSRKKASKPKASFGGIPLKRLW